MFIHDLVGTENNPIYASLAAENLGRQYSFLRSVTIASVGLNRRVLSLEVIRALNHHAITCLHGNAGTFRPCIVQVGDYVPPPHHQVPALMEMLVDEVNRDWHRIDGVILSAYVLWKLNQIHPFVNGNGRTARAVCHFILCLSANGWLPGEPIVPELLRANREEYVQALKFADRNPQFPSGLAPLHSLLTRLLDQQLKAAETVAESS